MTRPVWCYDVHPRDTRNLYLRDSRHTCAMGGELPCLPSSLSQKLSPDIPSPSQSEKIFAKRAKFFWGTPSLRSRELLSLSQIFDTTPLSKLRLHMYDSREIICLLYERKLRMLSINHLWSFYPLYKRELKLLALLHLLTEFSAFLVFLPFSFLAFQNHLDQEHLKESFKILWFSNLSSLLLARHVMFQTFLTDHSSD